MVAFTVKTQRVQLENHNTSMTGIYHLYEWYKDSFYISESEARMDANATYPFHSIQVKTQV
jgi:hypothetical protein